VQYPQVPESWLQFGLSVEQGGAAGELQETPQKLPPVSP
jgi:hypothetical protein